MLRWLGLGLLGLMVLLVAGGTVAYMLLDHYNFGPLASSRASAALGRKVSIESFHVTPGRWILVEMRSARLDNLPAGTRPLMAEVTSAVAEIDAKSLLHGPLLVRRLVVDGLKVLLERTADTTPNWKFRPNSPAQPQKATGRASFPVLLDAKFAGDVTFRTAAGAEFRTQFNDAQLSTKGFDSPVRFAGNGKYNGVAIGVEADLAPISALRDPSKPYDTDLRFKSGQTTLRFQGAMTDPLNLDGARGKIALDAPTPEAIYPIAGISSNVAPSLRLVGAFSHTGSLWHLVDGSGTLADGTILSADLQLDEGVRGIPDRLSAVFAFDVLDLDTLLGDRKRGGSHDADLCVAPEFPDRVRLLSWHG